MAFAGQQAGRRVEADPAGAGQVYFRPGVQVGEVGGWALGAFERLHVGDELDQVAGDEARRIAELAQQLDQQPGGVAAGAFARGERLVGRPDAGLHAHDVADTLLDHPVQLDQHVHGVAFVAWHFGQQRLEAGTHRDRPAERGKFLLQHRVVAERPLLGLRFEEEVERIARRHVHDEVDRHIEMRDALGEHHARLVVALRVLLPVDEVRLRARSPARRTGSCCGYAARGADGWSAGRARPRGRNGTRCGG